jgi:hypothetical protein
MVGMDTERSRMDKLPTTITTTHTVAAALVYGQEWHRVWLPRLDTVTFPIGGTRVACLMTMVVGMAADGVVVSTALMGGTSW